MRSTSRLARPVALKLLRLELCADERFRERMLRESRLAAALDHPNVIPIYEAGEADGRLFIAMRYVDGADLRTLLRREGRLDPARAVRIAAQVADALDAAHERGLVHRDVKASNVLVDHPGQREHCYLADFGLTQSASDTGPTDGQFMGTVDYVAPEQIRGDDLDGRADQYALGCLLFELLTGTLPFMPGSEVAAVFAHLQEPPPRATARNAELPAAVDGVLQRALAKDPAERYDGCRAFVDAAAAALGVAAHDGSARRLRGAVAAAALVVVAAVASRSRSWRGAAGRRLRRTVALVRIDPASCPGVGASRSSRAIRPRSRSPAAASGWPTSAPRRSGASHRGPARSRASSRPASLAISRCSRARCTSPPTGRRRSRAPSSGTTPRRGSARGRQSRAWHARSRRARASSGSPAARSSTASAPTSGRSVSSATSSSRTRRR